MQRHELVIIEMHLYYVGNCASNKFYHRIYLPLIHSDQDEILGKPL